MTFLFCRLKLELRKNGYLERVNNALLRTVFLTSNAKIVICITMVAMPSFDSVQFKI